MVHCPQCGAANPDESTLCHECGSTLPTQGDGVRCPMCGHGNPEERETCERCSARLTPLIAPAPASEPPDWMSESLPPSQPSETPAETEDESEEGIPDWLQRMRESALSEEPSPADGPEPEPEPMEDVPDWLSRLEPQAEEVPPREAEPVAPMPSAEPLAEDEVPDWLAELGAAEEVPVEEPLAEEPAPESEALDWLAELEAVEEAPVEEGPVAEPLAEAEVPDWLAELAPTEEAPAEEPVPEPEVPDWLAELEAAEEAPVEEAPIAEPLAEAEVPDWLVKLTPTEEAPAEEPLAEEPALEPEALDWLAELEAAEEVAVEEAPIAEPAAEAEVPDWLAQMIAPDEMEAVVPPLAETDEEALRLALEGVEVPDWLEAEVPTEAEEVPLAEVGPPPEEPVLEEAEIPAWLQAMRPEETPTPAIREEEREVETRGLLAGIAGVVPPALVVTAVPSVPARPEGISTEAAVARARLWQELIARSAQPALRELPRTGEEKSRYRIERWLVYAIVLLAVVLPFVADVDLSAVFNLDQPLTTGTGTAIDLVNEVVTQDAPVLVAFDFDPSYMGELGLQAQSLLLHLAQRQARIMATSLTPEGAGLAQQLIDDVLSEQGYQAGQDYVNLGYFPGDAVGIRSFRFLPRPLQGQAFDGTELEGALIFDGDESFALDEMALIAVLTSDADDMRWWVEQTTALERDLDTDLPLLAGVSAAIEALVRPYYDMETRQIDGLVVGMAGAVDYERALDWLDGPAHVRLNGQLVGQLAVLVLIVMGILFYGLLRRGGDDA